jgi:hypothetical protein
MAVCLQIYTRRRLARLGYWIGSLIVIALLVLALDPLDAGWKQATLAVTAVVLGATNVLWGRRRSVAPMSILQRRATSDN